MRIILRVPYDRWISFSEMQEICQETDILAAAVISVCVDDGDLETRCISCSPWEKKTDSEDLKNLEFKKVRKGSGKKKKTRSRLRLSFPGLGPKPLSI